MSRPIGIDLFSGAGGFSLGFEQAGFDVVAAVEIDPIHCATHKYNFPLCTTICSSIVDLTGEDIRRLANIGNADIDVVFGGAPCQGFSMIGKRTFDDPRNQLVSHYLRIVKELRPKYCVFENVKGLTLGKQSIFLEELVSALDEANYEVLLPYRVLNAADFGVPQDRQRLFVIGSRRGLNTPYYPTPTGKRTTVWEAIGDLPDTDRFEELKTTDVVETKWTSSIAYARQLRCLDEDIDNYCYLRNFNIDLLSCSLRTIHSETSKNRFLATELGKTEPVSRFHKLNPSGISNTLRAGTDSARGAFTSPRPIHPIYHRVITVREMARLHSYPDWFRFHWTKWHGARQIGNSVPPLLGRAVATEIINALGIKQSKPVAIQQLGSKELLYYDMTVAAQFFCVPSQTISQRNKKIS